MRQFLFERIATVDKLKVLDTLQFRIERFLAHVRIIFQNPFIGFAAVAVEEIGPALDGSADEALYQIRVLFDQILTSFDCIAVSAVAVVGEEIGRNLSAFLFCIDRFGGRIGLLDNFLVVEELGEAIAIRAQLFVLEAKVLDEPRPERELAVFRNQDRFGIGRSLKSLYAPSCAINACGSFW